MFLYFKGLYCKYSLNAYTFFNRFYDTYFLWSGKAGPVEILRFLLIIFITETNHFWLAYFILRYHFIEADVKHTMTLSLLLTFLSFFLETHIRNKEKQALQIRDERRYYTQIGYKQCLASQAGIGRLLGVSNWSKKIFKKSELPNW